MSKKIIYILVSIFIGLILISLIAFFIFKNNSYNSKVSDSNIIQIFEINKSQGAKEIGKKLANAKLIKNKYYFYYQIWESDLAEKIQAGQYELSPDMTIEEIVKKIVNGETKKAYKKLVIPEGFTNDKILKAVAKIDSELSSEFEEIVSCRCQEEENCVCQNIKNKYSFLKDLPEGVDLEGYLFPDTYFVYPEDGAAELATKFLNNFRKKVDSQILKSIRDQGKNLHEILTMASIVEKEVRFDKDKKIVAGIFWQRITDSYPLQSCATLAYALGEDKKQYTQADTQIESPFNTYKYSGLPPGPISNPGLKSIQATVNPKESQYYFFLNNPETGETVFSKDLEEHNYNKFKNGL